jgi:glutaredoxin/predicted transcriptional regulator
MSESLPFRVYWQPGCTSCLKAKEFLARHGIAFESFDVRARPEAMDDVMRLGARSIPVVAQGERWTYAQELDDLARFVGVRRDAVRLPPDVLVARLDALLDVAARHTGRLPDDALERLLPGRPDRAAADLAFHIAAIVDGLLDADAGGTLTYEHFLRRPDGNGRARTALVATLARTRGELAMRWARGSHPATVATYYGAQPLHGVLERTAWHVAQHVRQLESLLVAAGVAPDAPLSARELEGLPLPDGLWEREVGAPD